jgi:metallo-beta-lactamase family protein
MQNLKLTFIGATSTVTGSKTLIEVEGMKFLIDAGLYQEGMDASTLNWEDLSFDPAEVAAVFITHAHLDHTGFLPFLLKRGFSGSIYMTRSTAKLAKIILEDSAELMSEQLIPLYSKSDAIHAISKFKPTYFEETKTHGPLKFTFHKAGHILGASFIEFQYKEKTFVFSGDLGRYDDPMIGAPVKLPNADMVVMETTYGDRNRPSNTMTIELTELLKEVISNKNTLLIPCFALHRAQLISHLFQEIFEHNPELKIPMAFNSPMMKEVTKVYTQYAEDFIVGSDELKNEWNRMKFLDGFWDIEEVNTKSPPKIIIASSGMITGGRIWTHLKALGDDPNTIIFLPGYQSPGTAGFDLLQGVKTLRSPDDGIEINIKAKVKSSDAFSSHGDQEDLLEWISSSTIKPTKIYLIHGEDKAKKAFADLLMQKGFNVHCPLKNETIKL